jgi:hypothetical protein
MRTKLSFLLLLSFLFSTCKKESYETKPKLVLKEVQVQAVTTSGGAGSIIEVEFDVLDKEGDVKDSIFIQKIDAGKIPCPGNSILTNLNYRIPDYPSSPRQKAIFRLKFSTVLLNGYALLGGAACSPRKDTSLLRFWVKDKAGNRSDTITTAPIAIPL